MSVQNQSPAVAAVWSGWMCESGHRGSRGARAFTGVVPRVSHLAGAVRLQCDMAAKVDASEPVQDTFLAASRDIADSMVRPGANLRFWLKGILQHLMAKYATPLSRHMLKRQLGREMPVGSQGGAHDVVDLVANVSNLGDLGERARAMRCVSVRNVRLHEGLLRPARALSTGDSMASPGAFAVRGHCAGRLGVSPEAARKVWCALAIAGDVGAWS